MDWPAYLADFHRERAGVLEAVLSRTLAGDHSPYRWLARAVSATAQVVLDLACGSGPMSRELARPGRTVVGARPVRARAGAGRRAQRRVRGSRPTRLHLPFRDGSVDVVTSSLGLVVVQPMCAGAGRGGPGAAARRRAGRHRAGAPAAGAADVRTLTNINTRLRTKPQFPGPVELTGFAKALTAQGMRAVEDARERYRFGVRSRADAELMMSALYLPNTRRWRVDRAVDYLADRLARQEVVEVAIPMRRIVAMK